MANSSSVRPTFSAPSPGEILRQQSLNTPTRPARVDANRGEIDIAGNPFRTDILTDALLERGVMLAPLVVQWNYQVPAAKPFAKWIKTKDIILSKARLGINQNTADVHYFGTYIVQAYDAPDNNKPGNNKRSNDRLPQQAACQTLWGFTSESAMNHMFDLCRGRVERVSIVENDLRDFVTGLKGHIREAGPEHFTQSVLIASAAL